MTNVNCESVTLELPGYVRGSVEATTKTAVERHLRACVSCERELRQLEKLERLLVDHLDANLPVVTPSPTFASTFASRLAAEMAAEAEAEEQANAGLLGWLRRPWAVPLVAAAALGAIVLAVSLRTPAGPLPIAKAPEPAAPVAERPKSEPIRVARPVTPPDELRDNIELFKDYAVIEKLDILNASGPANAGGGAG
jgi:anti-sigma factor RsiW